MSPKCPGGKSTASGERRPGAARPITEAGAVPAAARPDAPASRHGGELEKALRGQAGLGPRAELEEVIAAGDQVMLVIRAPRAGQQGPRRDDDRAYGVATVRDGLVVGLRACRDRREARSLAGIG